MGELRDRVGVFAEGDGYRVFVPGPATYRYRLAVPSDRPSLVVEGEWTVGNDWEGRVVDMPLPEGRFVVVDTSSLQDWATENEARWWSSPYSVWAYETGTGRISFLENDDARPVPLLAGPETPVGKGFELWVPAGSRGLRFGFPDDPPIVPNHRAGEYGAAVPLPPLGRVVSAPAPERLLAMTVPVRFQVILGGRRFRQAGLEINVAGSNGDQWILTDAEGEAVLHAFAGSYSYELTSEYAEILPDAATRQTLDIRPPATELVVPLELVWRR